MDSARREEACKMDMDNIATSSSNTPTVTNSEALPLSGIELSDEQSIENLLPNKDPVNRVTESDEILNALRKSCFENVEFDRGPHNRVKLYVLCDQRVWDDRGTGHVACLSPPDDPNKWFVIVRLESSDLEKNVLESIIRLDTLYQKQQGTLIVWSESDTCDLALSFQEKNGCAEIWDKICKIQGKDPSVDDDTEMEDQEPSDSSASGMSNNACALSALSLPPCNSQHIGDFDGLLSNNMFTAAQREKMAGAIQKNGYISKLCELFQLCEDLESMESLHQLASIAKNLFLLNSNGILNELIDDKYFRDIVGMLEYDIAFPTSKKHRDFLWEKSKFREILPISSEELKAKIHQTYRLQYVQDVCLPTPSLFEENLLTVLSSHMFFNRSEIVNALLNEKDLVKQLFQELREPSIAPQRQRDLTNFLKELCAFAHGLQPNGPQGRDQFFKAMLQNDVLGIIDPCISSVLPSMRAVTVELLTLIIDFNQQIFREYLIKQFRQVPETKNDSLLINKLINHMLNDRDSEFTAAGQMSQVLRILLDPEGIGVGKATDKVEFLPMFYKRAFYSLLTPITANAKDEKPLNNDYYTSNRLSLVIDLMCFFVEHHSHNMRAHVIMKNIIRAVLVYLKSPHHFLAHSALKFIRRIVGLKDEIYIRNICDKKALDMVVGCFVVNGRRYNLLNSALIELFEFIRTEEIRPLMEYVMKNFWDDVFSKVNYVRVFEIMKNRYDQLTDHSMNMPIGTQKEDMGSPSNDQWKKEKEHDNDELFFSRDDDESTMNSPQQRKSGVEPLFPTPNRKRKSNDDDNVASIFGGNITPPCTSGTSRASRIVIKMATRSTTAPDELDSVCMEEEDEKESESLGLPSDPKKLALQIEQDAEESVVSSTSSSPSKCTEDTPELGFEPDVVNATKSTASDEQKKDLSPNAILLKGLSSRLVDYEVDSDDEEDDEQNRIKKEEAHKSNSAPPAISIPGHDDHLPTSTDEF